MSYSRCPLRKVRHTIRFQAECHSCPPWFSVTVAVCHSRSFLDKGESIIYLWYQKRKYCSLIYQ
ncbi:rCG58664 [Rattus norvegicus]|uniref:RCG58664 n=1 Tax=Rattus norvegicus TaxID=10116 RepID=A6JL19_RAT|nr:rCG58664 [Rattus norvegicus]